MLDRSNEFYREIKSSSQVTSAEATISWFCSGKKQELIMVRYKFPVYADGEFDCADQIQRAVDSATNIYLPAGIYGHRLP